MNDRKHILLVEDSPSLARTYEADMLQAGHRVKVCRDGGAARNTDPSAFDLILLDLGLPDADGMDLLGNWREAGHTTPVIVITADGSIGKAVDAMRLGAKDFLVKPFNSTRLLTTLKNSFEQERLATRVAVYEEKVIRFQAHGMIGSSMIMQSIYNTLQHAAQSSATVFVTGETGTGKELAARSVHELGPRASRRLLALNCAAFPKDLIESELFGHVKGAFTGANTDREGAVSLADKGTLFLDEICEMDLSLQAKLLRFLQLGTFTRVGETKERQVDVRIVAATNRDPIGEVRAGRFREDLYYRLHVIPVHLPPLRDRESDVVEIARTFLKAMAEEENKQFADFTDEAIDFMLSYPWPGNIRELNNVLRNIIVLNDGPAVTDTMLKTVLDPNRPPTVLGGPIRQETAHPVPAPPQGTWNGLALSIRSPGDIRPLWQLERRIIEDAIAACSGNIQKASRLLAISPSTIYRKRDGWAAKEREAS